MIGWVEFEENGKKHEVILGDDFVWECASSSETAARLNREFPELVGAAIERRGHDQLLGAAYRLGGVAWLSPGHSAADEKE